MKRVNLNKTEGVQDGDHTVRPVASADLLAAVLMPYSFTSFATADRRLCWAAGAIPLSALLFMLVLQLGWRLVFAKTFPLTVPGLLLYILFGAHLIQIPIAVYAWYQARTSKLARAKLPRKVLPQDYLLALLCPPAAVALHKASRVSWVLSSVCWMMGMLQAFLRALDLLDTGELPFYKDLGQGAVIHVVSAVSAMMMCWIANRTWEATYGHHGHGKEAAANAQV